MMITSSTGLFAPVDEPKMPNGKAQEITEITSYVVKNPYAFKKNERFVRYWFGKDRYLDVAESKMSKFVDIIEGPLYELWTR